MQTQSESQVRHAFNGGFAIYLTVLVLVAVAAFAAGRYIWQDNAGGSSTTTTNESALAPSIPGPALTTSEAAAAVHAYTEMIWEELYGPVAIAPSGPAPSLTAAEAFAAEAAYTEMVWDYLFGTLPPATDSASSAGVGGVDFEALDHGWDAEFGPLIYQEPTEAEIARAIAEHENALAAVLGE